MSGASEVIASLEGPHTNTHKENRLSLLRLRMRVSTATATPPPTIHPAQMQTPSAWCGCGAAGEGARVEVGGTQGPIWRWGGGVGGESRDVGGDEEQPKQAHAAAPSMPLPPTTTQQKTFVFAQLNTGTRGSRPAEQQQRRGRTTVPANKTRGFSPTTHTHNGTFPPPSGPKSNPPPLHLPPTH